MASVTLRGVKKVFEDDVSCRAGATFDMSV